jgi:hypothetical protein
MNLCLLHKIWWDFQQSYGKWASSFTFKPYVQNACWLEWDSLIKYTLHTCSLCTYTVLAPLHLKGKMDTMRYCVEAQVSWWILVTELQLSLRKRQRCKRLRVQDWIMKKCMFGISRTLLEKLRLQDKECHRTHFRTCEAQINYMLITVKPLIMKYDTVTREALPAMKLQITLQYLAKEIHFQVYNPYVVWPRQLSPDIFLQCSLPFQCQWTSMLEYISIT